MAAKSRSASFKPADVTDTVTAVTSKKVNEPYTFFNKELRDASYAGGNIYEKDRIAESQAEWAIVSEPDSYLTHVKNLSTKWPHLQLLADFMEIGTTPLRWAGIRDMIPKNDDRKARASRTNVTRLDYLNDGSVVSERYNNPMSLKTALTGGNLEKDMDKRGLRLFVVEDLSRDVIEHLGKHLDIEPDFFREQIFDYAWSNTRDRWVNPPNLDMVAQRNRWVSIRFVTARYFETQSCFQEGFREAQTFNVYRRPDDDQNNQSVWDDREAIVGVTRTRASFWFRGAKKEAGEKMGAVGVLLIDPTIKAGTPLWYGYRNWEETPSIKTKQSTEKTTFDGPPRDSLYNDLIYWAKRTPVSQMKTTLSQNAPSNPHIPMQVLLHLICAEWLTIADYIKTRLCQIEWEISFPEKFLEKHTDIDVALNKLHVWRRLVPLYREELVETLHHVFHFPCHTEGMVVTDTTSNQLPIAPAPQNPTPPKQNSINEYRADFVRALSYMEEYQKRIDRLTAVVTACISIKDSRHALEDNRNVARLTWLATFFIPLSYMATIFSMQTDITVLGPTMLWYAKTALPLAAFSLLIGLILALPPSLQRFASQVWNGLRWPWPGGMRRKVYKKS